MWTGRFCPVCGEINDPTYDFCGACYRPLPPDPLGPGAPPGFDPFNLPVPVSLPAWGVHSQSFQGVPAGSVDLSAWSRLLASNRLLDWSMIVFTVVLFVMWAPSGGVGLGLILAAFFWLPFGIVGAVELQRDARMSRGEDYLDMGKRNDRSIAGVLAILGAGVLGYIDALSLASYSASGIAPSLADLTLALASGLSFWAGVVIIIRDFQLRLRFKALVGMAASASPDFGGDES